jgi:hypothetical protein
MVGTEYVRTLVLAVCGAIRHGFERGRSFSIGFMRSRHLTAWDAGLHRPENIAITFQP